MKLGTVEPVTGKARPEDISRSRFRGGGGNGGNDGGYDGGDDPRFDDVNVVDSGSPDKAKFVTWFLLLVVLMTFGGMIGAYIVIATNGAAEWRPFDLPIQVWISTALIIASSITYHLAKNAFFFDEYDKSRKLLIATTALGAAFISSQILVWLALVNRGFYLRGNPYAGFFYNLESMATATEEVWFPKWEFKGMPWDNPVLYQKWSPNKFVNNFNTPTLVTAGELDYRVPVDQSLQLFTTLQLKGVPSKLIIFPDEGHWILKPQNSEFWYNNVLDWFSKHLK